jgi:hypothetical protein
MTKPPKRPRDPNQLAKFIADLATGEKTDPVARESPKAKAATAGGNARRESLSPERRKQIATDAAKKRWSSHD